MTADAFFAARTESSALKARIVAKYLPAWASVVARRAGKSVVYFDPFCGPGVYDDGQKGTALLVLEAAAGNELLSAKLVPIFSDSNADYCRRLKSHIADLQAKGRLGRSPFVFHQEANESLAAHISKHTLSPTLAFLDPCGYRGLSLSLVNAVLKDRYCDCLFFFNYDGVNRGIGVPNVASHIDALFGCDRAAGLREAIVGLCPEDRERRILRELESALLAGHAKYVRPFRFIRHGAQRTSHYLIFVSKSFRGYDIMKQVMAGEGKWSPEGIPLYEFDPQEPDYVQTGLFDQLRLEDLAVDILATYRGQTLTVDEIYENHSAGTDYVLDNYRTVLRSLEGAGSVVCEPTAAKRPLRKGVRTVAGRTSVTFPR